ncbi:hypothetical protein PBI_SCTP2_405 [Salicola phage SCTP-2]|nr:hypothetical protein PBI_SCTP2_405 [Salicola phage SCTP-2]
MSKNFISIFNANFPDAEYNSLFVFGSRVYGNTTGLSDIDYIVISDNMSSANIHDYINVSCYTNEQFNKLIQDHEITALEVLSLSLNNDCENYYDGDVPEFYIDLSTLRSSISSKASNSFVKAKKKLTVDKDYDFYCSMKSLFHAIRIYDFGKQLAEYGYIHNFESCNDIFYNIQRDYNSCINTEQILKVIDNVYKPTYNQYASEFRKVCPKE